MRKYFAILLAFVMVLSLTVVFVGCDDKDENVDIQERVNALWEELKTENSTELWVHITSITIVVGVLAIAIYDIYIKKKRSKDYRLRDKAKKTNKA